MCNTAAMLDTWLPSDAPCSSVRTETGTIATSGWAGSRSRSRSQARNMPAHVARTTSFTVQSKAVLMVRASASDVDPKAKRRCWPMRWLNTVRGACVRSWLSSAGTRSRTRGPPLPRRRPLTVWRMARRCTPSSFAGRWTVAARPRVSISACDGTRSGRHGVAGIGWLTGSGVSCIVANASCVPDAPSIAQWCVFEYRANLRPSSTPSMRYTSHSGRDRSSGRAARRDTTCSSWRSVPGAGTAMKRSWNSRSNAGSSIQYG